MTRQSRSNPEDGNVVHRTAELMQLLFDGRVTEEDATELLAIWERHPELERHSRANYYTEQVFRLVEHRRAFLPSPLLEKLKTAASEQFGRPDSKGTSSKPVPDPLSFDALDADELVRLAAASPALPKKSPRGETTGWKRGKERPEKTLKPYKPEKARWLPGMILLGLALLATAIYHEFKPNAEPTPSARKPFRPFAVIDSVLDVQWNEPREPFKEGRHLEAETLRFQSGIVQLTMNNGVRLAIRGPADVRLNTVGKLFCGQGELSATVPPTGKGFEVVTPFLSVVDLGTEFLVDVSPDGVETHTIQGKVELNRIREEKVDLPAGAAFQLTAGGLTKRFDAEPSRFLTDLFVRELRRQRDRREFDRWTAARQQALQMPGLRLFYDFEEDDARVINHADPSQAGRLRGAARCEGRWNRKKACSFYRKNDAVELTLSPDMTSATLWTSFRLDSFKQFNHVLLGSRGTDAGNFVWQIFGDGCIQLAVRPEKDARPVLFRTGPVFPSSRCGAWYQLATVLDADKRAVRTYLDGRLVDVAPMATAVPLNLGDATLGNWLPAKQTATGACLNGRIDQLMIFDRALADGEILELCNEH